MRCAIRRGLLASGILVASALALLLAGGTHASAAGPGDPAPLDTLPVPSPPNEGDFVRDTTSAVKLGKALFWDMQAGSDGRTACATCHFAAGADSRSRNQVNPSGDAFTLAGPNGSLTSGDFPLHRLADVTNRGSQVTADTNDVVGSQGVVASRFAGVTPGDPQDMRTFGPDPIFSIGGTSVRQATPRNSPSVIDAVFNFRNFWDGRAQNDFNGVSPFGARDTAARVGHVNASGGVDRVAVSLADSSLASQAVAPPGNAVEMSADGRTLSDVGRKLLSLKPLGEQAVSPGDSVLGADADPSGRGLSTSYRALVEQAFAPDWWDSNATLAAPDGRGLSLMEFNFPLFWGLAIQAYESTLVSDQTPADRFFAGDSTALNASAQAGLDVFRGPGRCSTCHLGAGLSDATVANVAATGLTSTDGGRAIDTGFLNIGVRPTSSDPGLGGLDPFGNPLSEARRAGSTNDKVSGSFKVPQLRNVALTAPYFHNGGQMTLRQVVDFYSRQGDFANDEQSGVLGNLGLTETQKNDLVAFLQSLTDPRVASASAPFDHPQLFVPSGAQSAANGAVVTDGAGHALDCFLQVPATGAARRSPAPAVPDLHRAVHAAAGPARRGRDRDGGCRADRPRAGGLVPAAPGGAGARDDGPPACPLRRPPAHRPHAERGAADAPARALRPRPGHARGRPRPAARRAPPGPEGRQQARGRGAGAADPAPGPRRPPVRGVSARAGRSARRPRRPAARARARSPGRRGG